MTMSDTVLSDNVATKKGGGLYFTYNYHIPSFERCTFDRNECQHTGCGAHMDRSGLQLTECWFRENCARRRHDAHGQAVVLLLVS